MDSKVLKKTVHHPYGATSDALQRTDALQRMHLGSRDTEDTKYTLWRRLKSPHRGGVQFSSIPCCPIGAWNFTVLAQNAQNAPKWYKNKVPLFLTIFSGSSRFVGLCSQLFLEKKWEPPPADHPPRGKPHFFPKFGAGIVQQTWNFPKSCV